MRGIKRSHFLNGAFKKTPHWSLCVIRMCRFLTIAFLGFPVLSSCCIMINQIRMQDIFDIQSLLFKSLIKCETHLESICFGFKLCSAKLG